MSEEYCRSGWRGNSQGTGLVPWLLAKMQRKSAKPSRIEVLERLALTPRNSLMLVRVETQRFLIATSGEGNLCIEPLSTGQAEPEPWISGLSDPIRSGLRPEADPC